MHFFHRSESASAPGQSTPEELAADKAKLHPEQAGAVEALKHTVAHSGQPGAATSGVGILGRADHIIRTHASTWIKEYIPGIEKYAAEEDLGNYVITNRSTGEKGWESMPIYVRAGMSLLFTGHGDALLGYSYINHLLIAQSIRQGHLFDQTEGATEHIEAFIRTYRLEDTLAELEKPDPRDYKTFNEFFYRSLKPGARPPASPEDPNVIVSSADCRLTVWENVDTATEFWIKGKQFNIPHLLHDDHIASNPAFDSGCSLAIFRLAPGDFHHWAAPMAGVIGPIKSISGNLYTVNPMAVRNPDVDVFTANKRDVRLLNVPNRVQGESPVPIILVSVGAMLVGSIAHTKAPGAVVQKGEEIGYFAYGGSTVIAIFPKGFMKFDEDLINYSKQALETVVKMGERIGTRV